MKRYGGFWEDTISKSNILLSYINAKLGKRRKKNVKRFKKNWRENLDKIHESLVNLTFKNGQYNSKTVYEPKKREIYILQFNPDRIVQHAIMNKIKYIYDKIFISDSYACRDGKGMHRGSNKVKGWVKINKYCLKMDIRKFYLNINHEILKNIIRKKIKDKNLLIMIDRIIDSFPGETNVPIGNFTSQWFGNIYMNELDYYVKHELRCKFYLRYCDDFCLFSSDKKQLKEWSILIENFVKEKLQLSLSKNDIFPVTRGVDFLGYRHFPNKTLIRKRTVKKFKKNFRKLAKKVKDEGYTNYDYIEGFLNSSNGWLKHANSYHFRQRWKIEELSILLKHKRYKDFNILFDYVANLPSKTYEVEDKKILKIIDKTKSINIIRNVRTKEKHIKIDISKLKNFSYQNYAEPTSNMTINEQIKINIFNESNMTEEFNKELERNELLAKEVVTLGDILKSKENVRYPSVCMETVMDKEVVIHDMYVQPSIKTEGKDYVRFIATIDNSTDRVTFTTESVPVVENVKKILKKFEDLDISSTEKPKIKVKFVHDFSVKSGRRYTKMISVD